MAAQSSGTQQQASSQEHFHSPMRSSLRKTTYSLHQRLEQLWTPQDHFVSISSYRNFLRLLLNAHCEVGFRAAIARGDETELTRESERVAALGVDLTISSPEASLTPAMPNSYAWGVGYVLNGSALGASIIVKKNYILNNWPSKYMKLEQNYVRTGQMKKFFENLECSDLDVSEVERGAIATFLLFDKTRVKAL